MLKWYQIQSQHASGHDQADQGSRRHRMDRHNIKRLTGLSRPRVRVLTRLGCQILAFRPTVRHQSVALWGVIGGIVFAVSNFRQLGQWLIPTELMLCALALVVLFDARYFVIPDVLNGAIAGIGLLSVALLSPEVTPVRLVTAIGVYIAARLLNSAYATWRGRDGLGQGDAKFLAAAACWLPWYDLGSMLLVGAISSLISVAIMLMQGGNVHAQTAIPFGAHLAFGLCFTWLLGPLVMH